MIVLLRLAAFCDLAKTSLHLPNINLLFFLMSVKFFYIDVSQRLVFLISSSVITELSHIDAFSSSIPLSKCKS